MRKRRARKNSGTGVKSKDSAASADPTDPNAPAPVPVFEVRTLKCVTGVGFPHVAPFQDTFCLKSSPLPASSFALNISGNQRRQRTRRQTCCFCDDQTTALGHPAGAALLWLGGGTISLCQQGNTGESFARDTPRFRRKLRSNGKWALCPFNLLRSVRSFDMTFVVSRCTTGSPIHAFCILRILFRVFVLFFGGVFACLMMARLFHVAASFLKDVNFLTGCVYRR